MTPYYERDGIVLYCGDCLEILPTLEAGSVDAVVTDPPYSSGGQFRGDRTQRTSVKYINSDTIETFREEFSGDNRDQRAFLTWCSLWLGQCLRVAHSGAIACVFADWRQVPTMTDAVQCGGWVWRNLVTWWKPGIRMQRGRFSSSSEFVIYASLGVPTPGEQSPQNVLMVRGVDGEEKDHIAEKPVDLLSMLIGVTPSASVVLDPFTGSGTTAIACIRTGRRFIGIELEEKYCEIAAKRIERELAQPLLPCIENSEPVPQRELFAEAC